jgi:nucleoside-diphosphate-sugar epimerase
VRLLVTGAGGRLGRPLVSELRAAGHEVVTASARDLDAMVAAARGADGVVHLAGGVRGPGRVTADVLNREGTARLMEALRRAGVAPRVVLASSAAVYGDRSGAWLDEDAPVFPDTDYGRAKVAAEAALRESGLPFVVARIAMVVGRGLPTAREAALAEGRAWLPGEGRNHVPLVHLADAVGVLRHLVAHAPDGAVVHVAAPATPTLRAYYDAVAERVVARGEGDGRVRFWSTWVPGALQHALARRVEAVATRVGVRPPVTPDLLRLWTASVRLRTERLGDGLGYRWYHPDPCAPDALDADLPGGL